MLINNNANINLTFPTSKGYMSSRMFANISYENAPKI